jgi:hypothetical protein
VKEWDECLAMLGDGEVDEEGNVQMTDDQDTEFLDRDVEEREINVSLKVLPVCAVIFMFTECNQLCFLLVFLLLSWRLLWFFSGYGLTTVYQYVTGTDTMCLPDWSCHMLVARPSF